MKRSTIVSVLQNMTSISAFKITFDRLRQTGRKIYLLVFGPVLGEEGDGKCQRFPHSSTSLPWTKNTVAWSDLSTPIIPFSRTFSQTSLFLLLGKKKNIFNESLSTTRLSFLQKDLLDCHNAFPHIQCPLVAQTMKIPSISGTTIIS